MKRAVLIIVILAVLVMAGGVQADGKTTGTWYTNADPVMVLRDAADYILETGSDPIDIEVFYDPDSGLWTAVVWP